AIAGVSTAYAFPRSMLDDDDDLSISGLMTAVVNYARATPTLAVEHIAASFQQAVVDVLVTKTRRAAAEVAANGLVLAGGVAANSALREQMLDACMADDKLRRFLPSRTMCPDHAA